MGIKNYTYKGIRVEAVQITNRLMSDADRAELNAWLDKHDVNVTIDTQFTYGVEGATAISVETPDYYFYMKPGDWLAYDGDIFFHITDDVFRKHYREITGKKVTDQDDAVVYATGGVLNPDKLPPIDGLINLDELPPVKIVTGGKAHVHLKPRGGATIRAAYLDEMDTVNKAHQPFVDAIRKAQAKAKAKAEAAEQALDAAELKQQATETNSETYQRHMELLDIDGHADQCGYCKDITRNTVPPAFNKALTEAVDKKITEMTRRRGSSHFHMDSAGKVTPRTRTDEWRVPLETLAMYYNDFTPKVKPTPKKKHTRNKDAKKAYDSIHGYLNTIKDLADTDLYDNPTIRGLADQAKRELDRLNPNLKGPNA